MPARRHAPPKLLAVIGTDTEVGKTIVTAAIARTLNAQGFKVGVFKPFASDPAMRPKGEGFSTDADLLARAACEPGGAEAVCGQHFSAPLAPLAAARLEGRRVDLSLALRQALAIAARHEITLVEGCGGWEVPLTEKLTTADYFARLGAPMLLVGRSGLGTINHTLLTLEAVRGRGLQVIGIVLNRTQGGPRTDAERTNPEILGRFARAPVWGPLPYRRALAARRPDRIDEDALPALPEIAEAVLRAVGEGGARRSRARKAGKR